MQLSTTANGYRLTLRTCDLRPQDFPKGFPDESYLEVYYPGFSVRRSVGIPDWQVQSLAYKAKTMIYRMHNRQHQKENPYDRSNCY